MVSSASAHDSWRRARGFDPQPTRLFLILFPHTHKEGPLVSDTREHACSFSAQSASSQQQAHMSATRRVDSSVEKDAEKIFQFLFRSLRISFKSLFLKLL